MAYISPSLSFFTSCNHVQSIDVHSKTLTVLSVLYILKSSKRTTSRLHSNPCIHYMQAIYRPSILTHT